MFESIIEVMAYEKGTGKKHHFEAYDTSSTGPKTAYTVMLDGTFYGVARTEYRVKREIKRAIEWFDWIKI